MSQCIFILCKIGFIKRVCDYVSSSVHLIYVHSSVSCIPFIWYSPAELPLFNLIILPCNVQVLLPYFDNQALLLFCVKGIKGFKRFAVRSSPVSCCRSHGFKVKESLWCKVEAGKKCQLWGDLCYNFNYFFYNAFFHSLLYNTYCAMQCSFIVML